MSTREEFGNYLLLKKLNEDPLGESFRAGRIGQQGLEQVVLMRTFNGYGLNGELLWQTMAPRKGVQAALKNPNIGQGSDVGRVRGVTFAAYDYISGKNLAELSAQARRQRTAFPVDHALLIAERISLALSAAYETKLDGQRLMHGFVVPNMVVISNEGETRLLGFEAGPALRDQASALPSEIQRYLAPEALAGHPLCARDDVFSLGALLYELLTGTTLPTAAAEGYESVIDAAVTAAEEQPIPAPIAELLKRSLVLEGDRLGDVVTWHKALSQRMIDGGFNATTFNLAFFMHNLFRADIERESREMEEERSIEVTPRQAVGVGASAMSTQAIPVEAVREARAAAAAEAAGAPIGEPDLDPEPSEPASKKGLWLGLAALLLLSAGAAVWWFYLRGPSNDATQVATTTPPVVTAPVEDPLAEGGLDGAEGDEALGVDGEGEADAEVEDLQAQIDRLVAERTEAMASQLEAKYDDDIKNLQKQLKATQDEAQKNEEARRKEEAAAEEAAETIEVASQPAAGADAPPQRPAQTGAGTDPAAPTTAGNAAGNPGATAAGETAEPVQTVSETVEPPKPKEPEVPKVEVGDLVGPGPGVVAPKVVRRATPRYPAIAARLRKQATIDVRVLVDENGKVLQAEITGENPGYGFDQEAITASRRSTYQPATKDDVRVKMWTVVRWVFKR